MDFAVGTKVRFIERHTPPGVEPNAVRVIVAVEKVSSQLGGSRGSASVSRTTSQAGCGRTCSRGRQNSRKPSTLHDETPAALHRL